MAADIGVTQGTPPSPPMAASVNVPAAATTTTAAAPMMAEGGATSGGSFWKSLNWLEIGFMVLGATSLFVLIKYYRDKAKEDKKERSETQRQVDELKMNLQNALKNKYKTL